METLTLHKLEETVREYFAGYLQRMSFKPDKFNDKPMLVMTAYRNNDPVKYHFQLDKWRVLFDEGIEYHTLENIMGQFKRDVETILLENSKNCTHEFTTVTYGLTDYMRCEKCGFEDELHVEDDF